MTVEEFLRRVLPANTSGDYILSSQNKQQNQPWRDRKISGFDKLLDALAHTDRNADVYFACGTFAGHRRGADLLAKQVHHADLDCGPTKPYQTKAAAAHALLEGCKNSGFFVPSLIVDSGNGLHVYWVLSSIPSPAEWDAEAAALAQWFAANNILVDTKITQDRARVLRVPGTYNYKNGVPHEVKVVFDSGAVYDPQQFLARASATSSATHLSAVPAEMQVDPRTLGAGVGNTGVSAPAYFRNIAQKCGVMAQTVAIGGKGQPGAFWHKVIHLLAWCADGHDWVSKVSDQHEAYNPEAAEARYQYALIQRAKDGQDGERRVGPTRCAKFEEFYPEICQLCPHHNIIATPKELGDDPVQATVVADLPPGYSRNRTGIWKEIASSDDGTKEYALVCPLQIRNLDLVYIHDKGLHIEFDVQSEFIERHAVIPAHEFMADSKSLVNYLATSEIVLSAFQVKELRILMVAWTQQIQRSRAASRAFKNLGWVAAEDSPHACNGFAIGDTTFWANGATTKLARATDQLSTTYTAKGSLETWKQIANLTVRQGRQEVNTAIASAFAGPLVRFSGVRGVLLSIVSTESGTGKSTALRLAQSVWGNPTRGMNALNDTANAVTHIMGWLNSIPSYWDELRMKEDVNTFIRLMFQLGQGGTKKRMSPTTELRKVNYWQTMITVGTNEPLADHIEHTVGTIEAGRARVLEAYVGPLPISGATLAKQMKLFDHLETNYGHAGAVYAAWLAQNEAAADDLVHKVMDSFSKMLKPESHERFWLATIAVLFVGAAIAKKLSLVDFDLPTLQTYLVELFLQNRRSLTKVRSNVSSINLLTSFLNKYRDHGLVTDVMPPANPGRPPKCIVKNPGFKSPLVYQLSADYKLRIIRKNFTEWIYVAHGAIFSSVIDELVSVYGAVETHATIGAGTGVGVTSGRVPCIDLNLRVPALAQVADFFSTGP